MLLGDRQCPGMIRAAALRVRERGDVVIRCSGLCSLVFHSDRINAKIKSGVHLGFQWKLLPL